MCGFATQGGMPGFTRMSSQAVSPRAAERLSLVGSSHPRSSVASVPERTTGRKLSEPFNAVMDQRLRQLVEAHQRANISPDVPWTEIATHFENPVKNPKQCRERYPPTTTTSPPYPPSTVSPSPTATAA